MIRTQETALSRRRQWNILLPAGVAMALSLAGDLTLYAVLPAYAAGLGIGLANLGLLLSANRLVRLVSNPLVGMLSRRVSRRGLVLAGLTTGVISTLLYVLAEGFWVFLLGRLLWGISWSLLYIGVYCMVLDVTEPEERGWGSGMLQTFYFAGLAINPLIGGLLSARLGFSNALVVCAGLQALGLVGALLFLPDTRPASRAGDEPPRARFSLRRGWQGAQAWFQRLSPAWFRANRAVISANSLYLLTLFIGDGIIMSTITLYLQQRYGEGIGLGQALLPVASAGGILIALRAVVSAGAAPLAGRWSDGPRAPGERVSLGSQRWVVTGWGALLAVAGCLLLAVDGGFGMIAGGIVLASLGSGMLMAVLPVIVSSAVGEGDHGLAVGILVTSGDVGCAVAPLISYAMLGALSLSQLYFISAGLLCAAGVAIWAWFRR